MSLIDIIKIFLIIIIIDSIFSLVFSPSILNLGIVIGLFTYLRSIFEFKSLFSYLGLLAILLIQYILLFYVIFYSIYDFYNLFSYLVIIIVQTISYIFCQPMFKILTRKIEN